MTTPEQSNIDPLSAQLSEAVLHIENLQAENSKLQQEIENLSSERDRILIENKLAIEDAELVRSFKRTNYAPLIEEMFDKPAKKLRRQTVMMLLLAIAISMSTTYLLSGYLILQNNQIMGAELSRLHNNLDLLLANNTEENTSVAVDPEQIPDPAVAPDPAPTTSNNAEKETSAVTEPAPQQQAATITEPALDVTSPPQDQERTNRITRETDSIVSFIQSIEKRKDFPKEFRTDKSKMTQLYMIVSQQAGNNSLYYQSYINAMTNLGVEEGIRPQNIEEMATIDKDFLHALFSAYLITSEKQAKGWRYRDEDRKFSTYYNNTSPYQLGAWKIVNKSQDYSLLPKIFAVNIQRVRQQLDFNGQLKSSELPNNIFYLAYNEENKNNAVRNLFRNDSLINKDGSLYLNITQHPLPLKKDMILRVQKVLASQGFIDPNIINGIAGPKTAAAVKAYQEKTGLLNSGQIDLALIHSLNLSVGYDDLAIDTVFNR